MEYHDIYDTRVKAERTIERANTVCRQTARLLVGRLKSAGIGVNDLCELKRELRDFNMHTYSWRE